MLLTDLDLTLYDIWLNYFNDLEFEGKLNTTNSNLSFHN